MAFANSIYGADISVAFDDGVYTEILPERIQYLMIDYRYENINILPVLYLSLKIPLDLHDRIIDSYEFAKFYLDIDKKNSTVSSSLATNHIHGAFSYVCSNKEQNSAKNLNMGGTDDRAYVSTVIGLVSTEIMSSLRHSFNNIYREIPVEQLVNEIALKDINGTLVMTPIKYSDEIESFLVPPTTSRFRMLELIFDQHPFYDTYFNFFMDFDNITYLLDKTGEPVEMDGNPSTIYFNITNKDDINSIFPGSSIRNGSSQIYVNASQTRTNINESSGQIANTISAFDYDNDVQNLTISESFVGGAEKKINVKTENAAVYKNEIVNSTVVVELYKQSIDAGLITPNREYIVTQEGNYSQYNGRYILAYKQEVYAQNGVGGFNTTCTIGLKRVNEIEVAMAKEDTSASVRHKAMRTSAVQSSSASYGANKGSTKSNASDRTVSSSSSNSANSFRKARLK